MNQQGQRTQPARVKKRPPCEELIAKATARAKDVMRRNPDASVLRVWIDVEKGSFDVSTSFRGGVDNPI